jgi:cation transport regulator ChaC
MSKSHKIGILAYGSLINDPGVELKAVEVVRVRVETPFRVEFARYSRSRSRAPTLVPVTRDGARVRAKILVLSPEVSREQAEDMLWRRESGKVCSGKKYPRKQMRNAIRLREIKGLANVDTVLYTDFYATSKIRHPKPGNLARRAISSAKSRRDGKDGITYLMDAKCSDIRTPLMEEYETEILRLAVADSLSEALRKLQKDVTEPVAPPDRQQARGCAPAAGR